MPAVLVPWRGGCPHRENAWAWVRCQYERAHPDWNVIRCQPPGGQGQPWIKADALMPAIRASESEIIVVADADAWTEGLAGAVEAVEDGFAWAIPHASVHRLTQEATAEVLGGDDPDGKPVERRSGDGQTRPYRGILGGGIVIASQTVLLSVPFDRRFSGWGQEDESFGFAMWSLFGRPWRGIAPLFHLWHPPQKRLSRRRGSVEGWKLRTRYHRAIRDPEQMRALLKEAA